MIINITYYLNISKDTTEIKENVIQSIDDSEMNLMKKVKNFTCIYLLVSFQVVLMIF